MRHNLELRLVWTYLAKNGDDSNLRVGSWDAEKETLLSEGNLIHTAAAHWFLRSGGSSASTFSVRASENSFRLPLWSIFIEDSLQLSCAIASGGAQSWEACAEVIENAQEMIMRDLRHAGLHILKSPFPLHHAPERRWHYCAYAVSRWRSGVNCSSQERQ